MRQSPLISGDWSSFLVLALLGGIPACNTSEQPVTYHHDAKPLLDRYCTQCHQKGAIGPIKLTDYGLAKDAAPAMQLVLTAGTMPPWMPSDRGLPLRYSRQMRAQDRELLLRWITEGAQEGDMNDAPRTDIPPSEVAPLPRADLLLDTGAPYQPKTGLADDYRCFIIDPFSIPGKTAPDGNLYMTNGVVNPGTKGIVHHSTIYAIPANLVSVAHALDAADPGPGYTCFGDPLHSVTPPPGVEPVLGWEAPGGPWLLLPSHTAVRITRGSVLVVQMHYSLLNYHGESDHTTAAVELTTTPPINIAHTVTLSDPPNLHIPAGAPDAKQRFVVPIATIERSLGIPCAAMGTCDLTVFANFPHMHLLGTQVTTSIVDGPILVDIPHWNFDWQSAYLFQTPVMAHHGNSIAVECHYNNTFAKQPIADGGRPPHDVAWGPGALDEMCLSYLFVLSPRR